MKKFKCLLGLSLMIVSLMFCWIQNANARSFANNPCYMQASANEPNHQWDWVERWINDWWFYLNWNNDDTYTYMYNSWSSLNLTQLRSWNKWDYFACNLNYYASRRNRYRQSNYNFIKVFKPCNLWECSWDFYWWNESWRTYRHFSTMWWWYIDDNDITYDMWFPRHWTIILYSSETRHTIQFIWKHVLRDLVLYFDPLETDQNLWVLNFENMKAWSTQMQSDYDYYMFWMWDLDEEMLNDLDFEYSYTINTWWTFFRPNTAWQLNISEWESTVWRYTEVWWMWLTMTYTTDLSMYPPFFQWSDVVDVWSWQWVESNMQAWNNYQACERDYSYRNFIVSSRKACASDYQNWLITAESYHRVMSYVFDVANIWNDSTWELQEFFSWYDYSQADWCQSLIANATTLVNLYKLRWDPYDYWYYSDVVWELKYISQENPYDITQQCWSRPEVPTEYNPVNNNSNVCNLDSWSNIVNCFSFGSSDVDWSNKTYFDMAIDNIKAMVWGAFDSKFLSPIRDNYNNWKGLIWRNWLSCDDDNLLLSIPYMDYMVWLIAILIFILLCSILI